MTRIWTATDACGNSAIATQIVTIDDTIAPTLNGVPGDEMVQCRDDVPAAAEGDGER